MNIGIDASLLKINLAGMGVYVKEMIERFSAIDSEDQFFLFTNADFSCKLTTGKNFTIVKNRIKPHIVWLQLIVPVLIKKYKIDVFWQPDHILPIKVKGSDYYVTIHDLSGYKLHNVALRKVETVFKLFMPRTCRDAKKIITISEFSKKDIIETLHIEPDKIDVIYNGDSPYRKGSHISDIEKEECLRKYSINKQYFLFIGTINPRKNVVTIVKAFNHLRERGKNAQLAIVGEYGWNSEDVMNEIEISPYKDDIKVTGFVSELEKEIFYRNARCLVFPSLLEGLGLPVIEAMSVGTPVITSNNSSLPEVGGDVALYINDCLDSSGLSKLMTDILEMNEEQYHILQVRGIQQSKKFSRQECAEKTLSLITTKEE